MSSTQQKPELSYPCEWAYVIIGRDEAELRVAVADTIKERIHTVTPSHTSAHGKYVSLKIHVVVRSEEDRLEIFDALTKHPATKVVI